MCGWVGGWLGGGALIKFTGGSDLLLTVSVGYHFVLCFSCFFQPRFEPPFFSFRPMLVPLWVSMLMLLASFRYTFFDHETCSDLSSTLEWILVSCLMVFDTFFWSRTQPAKT